MKKFLLILALATPAAAASSGPTCPPDRPIERSIVTAQWCTLLACLGELRCPKTGDCYRLPAKDCNTCTPSRMVICMTPAEADAAAEK